MKRTLICLMLLPAWALLAAPAAADWDPGDDYKMHYPQLPDPIGWDVRINNARRQPDEPLQFICADDWLCTDSGPVADVHFWVSWMQDIQDRILNVHLSIHDNIPVGPEGWSIPGALLWQRDFAPGEFALRPYGQGDQGWYDPVLNDWWRPDHTLFQQINVVDILDPFIQEEGHIYWLDVSVDIWGEGETGKLGWKTSLNHWNDDAVYWDMAKNRWVELRDPLTGESLDLAFVITPEPGTCVMLLTAGAAGLLLLVRRKRR
jgi:hypothetical protein